MCRLRHLSDLPSFEVTAHYARCRYMTHWTALSSSLNTPTRYIISTDQHIIEIYNA